MYVIFLNVLIKIVKKNTFDDKYLCKSHNELYKDICAFRKCNLYKIDKHDKCLKHKNL